MPKPALAERSPETSATPTTLSEFVMAHGPLFPFLVFRFDFPFPRRLKRIAGHLKGAFVDRPTATSSAEPFARLNARRG
jgi:hypothetical protein